MCMNTYLSDLHEDAEYFRNHFDLRDAFGLDPARFDALSLDAPGVKADMSKCLWDKSVVQSLLKVARDVNVEKRRDAMFNGENINTTENRPVLHASLRRGMVKPPGDNADMALTADVHEMLELAQRIRGDTAIDDVVHIGIGGSALGPEMVIQALAEAKLADKRFHFVSNIDGCQLQGVLKGLVAARTLFIVASKSWTTLETLRNARSALDWFEESAPGLQTQDHFVALSAHPERARAMGFGSVVGMPEGIGGRYSLWSSIGLPIAIAIGPQGFKALLEGAHAMDTHFLSMPLEENLPVWLGVLDVWNATYLGFSSRCVVPYHHGLKRLPAYLQQLDMESNGKRVQLDGRRVDGKTGAIVWGDVGSDSQHAFFQWLHQGTQRTPVEFIVSRQPSHELHGHHEPLLANAIAQAQALMCGAPHGQHSGIAGHQDFPGNRPSCFFVLEKLTPFSLGAFLALQEHRVFVAGTVWGVNSFDQWGVELGKVLASDIELRLQTGHIDGLDSSTAGLVRALQSHSTKTDPAPTMAHNS